MQSLQIIVFIARDFLSSHFRSETPPVRAAWSLWASQKSPSESDLSAETEQLLNKCWAHHPNPLAQGWGTSDPRAFIWPGPAKAFGVS